MFLRGRNIRIDTKKIVGENDRIEIEFFEKERIIDKQEELRLLMYEYEESLSFLLQTLLSKLSIARRILIMESR